MWWAQTVIDRAAIAMVANDALVAEQGFAAEDRQDLRDDAEERQRDDVDLGMTEEPEQVLPQQRPAVLRIIDLCAEPAVRCEAEEGRGQHREGHEHEEARDERVPGEDRHAEHRHARSAHRDDRRDEVDASQDGAEPRHGQAQDPQVTSGARGEGGCGQRGVGEPTERCGPLRRKEAS
jgi:hypothetical protein